ncbi:MAG: Hsp20/alpha crystallin family protein, partial [Thermoanaerobaculia bacterium]
AQMIRDPFQAEMDQFLRPGPYWAANLFGHRLGEDLRNAWVPPVDVQETEDAYVFTAELPGMSKDDVSITLEDNLLTLSGERSLKEKEEGENFHRVERAYGSFSRSFSLPSQVDSSKVEASFKDGLLTVEIAKAEQAKPRKIEIH